MVKEHKNNGFLKLIPVIVLGICLVVSLVFNVIENSRLKSANAEYEKLSQNYDNLGQEVLSAKNDTYNLEKKIESLNAERDELLETIDNYSKALDLANRNIYLSESHYLTGKNINILEAVAGDEIGVDSSQYYVFYSELIDASVSFFSLEETLIETKNYSAGETYFITLPEDCGFVTVTNDGHMMLASTGISVTGKDVEDDRYFYVVSDKSPIQMSISEAVSKVKEHGTVLVMPGEYKDNVLTRDKEVNIQGVSRDNCLLYSNDNDYYNPPLEISAGKVSNLSIRAVDDGLGLGADLLAYAVHADFDYMYGRDLTFENCNLTSDFNAGAGIGLRGNGTLTFRNCYLEGYYHGLFVHDSKEEDVGGKQNLVVDKCTIAGINGDVALVLSSCLTENADVNVKFVDNTLANLHTPDSQNLLAALNEDLSKHEGFFMDVKNFRLDEASKGNNVDKLNY